MKVMINCGADVNIKDNLVNIIELFQIIWTNIKWSWREADYKKYKVQRVNSTEVVPYRNLANTTSVALTLKASEKIKCEAN